MLTTFFNQLSRTRKRLLIFFAVFGPGVISAIADNDAGGVATYSILASKFGYSILFLLLAVTLLLAITQEIGARISIVSGRGLGDLIREYFGVRMSLVIFGLLFIANLGTIIANFAGLSAALRLLHIPYFYGLVGMTGLIILFVIQGNYQTNQKIFLVAGFLYVVYIFSAFLAQPDWIDAMSHLIVPKNIPLTFDFLLGSIALLGTTVTPWGQFFISSFVRDKKLTIDKLKYERLEVYFGSFITDFFSFFMVVAVASTLYKNGIIIERAEDAALAIVPFAGQYASYLFAAGLLVASFMGIIIISLTTAYAFSEFFGYEGSLDLPYQEGKQFHTVFLLQIFIALSVALLPGVSLFGIVLFTQSLNGVLLPVIIFFLLRFANDRELMGKHVNTAFYNAFATTSAVIIIIASICILIGGILGKL